MRKIVLSLLFCIPTLLTAQFVEQFSDGNFTHNPTWQGDIERFLVNELGRLQLNDAAPLSTNRTQLSTPSEICLNSSWELWLQLDFEPTTTTFATVWLAADAVEGENCQNGYAVQIRDRRLSLIRRRNGVDTTLGRSTANSLVGTPIQLTLRVQCDEAGVWRAWQKKGSGSFTAWLGNGVSNPPQGAFTHFGVALFYSTTRNRAFQFDDIVVKSLTEAPTPEPDPKPKPDPEEENPDETPTPEPKPELSSFLPGDVVISEVMANPVGAPSLPEVEYVELTNHTVDAINLGGWLYYYGGKSYKLSDYPLAAGAAVVLCNPSKIALFHPSVPLLAVASFPVIANAGKMLHLEAPDGRLISFVEYSEKFYRDELKKRGGFSLEAIDLANLSGAALNWRASDSPTGGTPGAPNSVATTLPDHLSPEVAAATVSYPHDLVVTFTKAMDEEELLKWENYALFPQEMEIKSISYSYPYMNQVTITLIDSISVDPTFELELYNFRCFGGNSLPNPTRTSFGSSLPIDSGEVVINELLFKPRSGGAEYVELYNRSSRPISLEKLYTATRKSDGTLQYLNPIASSPLQLQPGAYLCLSKAIDTVIEHYPASASGSFQQHPSLPPLSDGGGTVVLLNQSGRVMDSFTFSDALHTSREKNRAGIALERISPDSPANSATNWRSATEEVGYGTPGVANSAPEIELDGEERGFWLLSPFLTPERGGEEAEGRLAYALEAGSEVKASITLFDRSGVQQRSLLLNATLSGSGLIRWDGRDQQGALLPAGVYILLIEQHDARSRVQRQKMAITLLR